MLKQSFSKNCLQKLSPQQIQMIKLLEIPAIQLEQRIKKELEENPVLEEGNEDPFDDQDDQEGGTRQRNNRKSFPWRITCRMMRSPVTG